MKKLLLVVFAGLLVVGCGRKGIEGKGANDCKTIEELNECVSASLENGNTNNAVDIIISALGNDTFKDSYGELFRSVMFLTLDSGSVEKSKKLLLDAVDNDSEYLSMGLGQVCRYYAGNADTNGLLDWTKVLVDKKVPEKFLGTVYSWRLESLYRADKEEELFALFPIIINEVTDINAVYLLSRFSNLFVNSDEFEKQNRLLKIVSESANGNSVLESFIIVARINALVAKKSIKEAEKLFTANAKDMTDRDAGASFKLLRKNPRPTAGDPDLLNVFVLRNLADKPQTIKIAARDWVNAASKRKNYGLVISRINELMDMSLPPFGINNIYLAQFYPVTESNDKVLIDKMMKIGDVLMLTGDEKEKQSIRALQLDGSFLLEDYAKAIKCIEAGIEGRDEDWHKMALNKVKAHLALKEGRIEDAIARFREFMEVIKDGTDGEVDPATGLLYSKEMMLGQNALRIGNLYKTIKKPIKAAQAYEEAADYYTQALSSAKPDSKEYALIQSKIKEIPVGGEKGTPVAK